MKRALLFDLDGTLLASDPLHARAFIDLFAANGITIDDAFYTQRIQGRLNADIFAEFFPEKDGVSMANAKEATFRDMLGTSAPPMPGLFDLLDLARTKGWATAVVTNAPRDNAEHMLNAIGAADAFDTLVVSDDCSAGKPDPSPYLTAMTRLGVTAEASMAFEDSPSGIGAAVAAQIFTVGIRSSLTDAQLRAAGASASLADFSDPAVGALLERQTGAAA